MVEESLWRVLDSNSHNRGEQWYSEEALGDIHATPWQGVIDIH
jgi:hypothetical protein